MSGGVLAMMLATSLVLGFIALFALLWGLKTKQFEDYTKFLDGTKFDSEESLNDAYEVEARKKEAKEKKNYRPPD
ncbi:cbb3-type cytochrome oxidase assembly protein CcoS [uncultured Campylobacter sp.]|uniref:cbb3-type cytochrome oxidase assembly protein CcoS n=1 Tax=uncultured Campylobacter sp. TaxID=218934 RepID=UPI0026312D15|nr:cbb3-type cytochrome oxidase assembly protein CcoS [uncultured Campylobacter sp.]